MSLLSHGTPHRNPHKFPPRPLLRIHPQRLRFLTTPSNKILSNKNQVLRTLTHEPTMLTLESNRSWERSPKVSTPRLHSLPEIQPIIRLSLRKEPVKISSRSLGIPLNSDLPVVWFSPALLPILSRDPTDNRMVFPSMMVVMKKLFRLKDMATLVDGKRIKYYFVASATLSVKVLELLMNSLRL